jgi:hypothetical protein
MDQLNTRLAGFDPEDTYDEESGDGLGLGLYVVARLAHRHGVRVRLREQKQGGVAAVVVLPKGLLAAAPGVAGPVATPVVGGAPALSLPGVDAEANSNVLHGRSTAAAPEPAASGDFADPADGATDTDPLIAAAEQAVRERGAHEDAVREPAAAPQQREPAVPAEDVRDPATVTAGPGEQAVSADAEDVRDPATGTADAGEQAVPAHAEDGTDPATGTPGPGEEAVRADTAPAFETPAETTMELLAPEPPSDDPDAPGAGTAPDGEAGPVADAGSAPQAGPEPPTGVGLPARTTTDPYAIGPDTHDRVEDEPERITAKGLPKRTPKISAPAPAPRPRAGGVDAEALRRRLGGFHRGAQEGRRDVEAEIAEETSQTKAPEADAVSTAADVPVTGGTVEEASS